VPAAGSALTPVASSTNPLVSRGLADLVQGRALKVSDAIPLDPKDALSYYNRGRARQMKKEYDNAIKDFDEAIRLDPNYEMAYFFRGDAWLKKGDLDQAIKDYDEVIRLHPSAFMYFYCSRLWLAKEDYDEAIKYLDEAIRLDPADSFSYSCRGEAWYFRKDYDKAIEDFDEAIRLDPEDADSHYCRGGAWSEKKDYAQAIRDFGEAIRLDPNCAAAYDNFALLLATCPDEKVRDGRRAIQLATKACELTDWESAWELSTLAAAHAEAGQFDEAVRYETKALEHHRRPDRDGFRQRLELYKRKQPFRERT
jgi:tetratricopeptide (TPR) repeat protein